MTIYQYPALPASSLPSGFDEYSVGEIPTTGEMLVLTRLVSVLATARWTATVIFPPEISFASGSEIGLCLPLFGGGRIQPAIWFQSPKSWASGNIALSGQDGSNTGSSYTTTLTVQNNPTDLRGTSSGLWRTTTRTTLPAAYAPRLRGCPRIKVRSFVGSGPAAVTFAMPPTPTYASGTTEAYCGYDMNGNCTPAWPNSSFANLTAGWARNIEAQLAAAETAPIVLGILPFLVSGISGHAQGTKCWTVEEAKRALAKQIPLSPRRKTMALYWACDWGATPGAGTVATFQIGGQRIRFSGDDSSTLVWSSGTNSLQKRRLTADAFAAVGSVGGCGIVSCQLLELSGDISGGTAFLGEDIDV